MIRSHTSHQLNRLKCSTSRVPRLSQTPQHLSELFGGDIPSQHVDRTPAPRRRRLFAEPLEDRQLLALWFVDDGALGANNGSSWANAFTDLQLALGSANASDQIWVASGTYRPTNDTNRALSFNLKNGVGVYGGFSGTETLLSQRDWATNVTTLSGDIGTVGDNSDNSYHVMYASSVGSDAVLDGFEITAGNADSWPWQIDGAGIVNSSSSPTLTNLYIHGNSAIGNGGGIYNREMSSPKLTNITLTGNFAGNDGGGIYNSYASSPTLIDVTLSSNVAANGGGIAIDTSSPIMHNVLIYGNFAYLEGGGVHYASGLEGSSVTLTNVTLAGNSAVRSGGGVFSSGGFMTLTNVIFISNSADEGGGISNLASRASAQQCVV